MKNAVYFGRVFICLIWGTLNKDRPSSGTSEGLSEAEKFTKGTT